MDFFQTDVLINFFIRPNADCMGKFRPGKAESRQYKTGIRPCWDETFQMYSQDTIYEKFVTLSGKIWSRPSGIM